MEEHGNIQNNSNFNLVTPCYSTIICGYFCSISIDYEGKLLSFGENCKGKLGNSLTNQVIYPPKLILDLQNIKMVACGKNHTICIDYDGNTFSIGSNTYGELGIGSQDNECEVTSTCTPQKIDIPPIDFVSCGSNFTVCKSFDGFLYSFGLNIDGQLGIGNKKNMYFPQLIADISNVNLLSCGAYHCICSTFDNKYYSWGYNINGQLGHDIMNTVKPVLCINWPSDIVSIKSGNNHNLLLNSSGHVYSFGCNRLYQEGGSLGLSKDISKIFHPTLIKDLPLIKRIECGYNHSMCIDINDKLWVFGYNYYGQLGLGDKEDRYKPTLNESLHDIIDISSGGHHTFVKTINNEIYTFGRNNHSELGIKSPEEHQLTPIQVFKDNEDIWGSIRRSKQKSARK